MIDALAHLHDPRLTGTRDAVLRDAFAQGVTDIICANAPFAPKQGEGAVRLWRAVGLHPREVTAAWPTACDAIAAALGASDVVAVGEMGLDGREGMPSVALQEAACLAQLRLARTRALPVIVHCVGRWGRLAALLRQHGQHAPGLVLHAFAGPAEWVGQLVELGAFFSFGGLVTRPQAKKCHKAAVVVPSDRLLVESDAPDMPAHGWNGPSTPAMLPDVLAALGRLRQSNPSDMAESTAENARRLYNIARPRETGAM